MRTDNRTYNTLLDRAEYLLDSQIRTVNAFRNQVKDNTQFSKDCEKMMHHNLNRFAAMCEMFDSIFRDYTVNIELDETTNEYKFDIEAR